MTLHLTFFIMLLYFRCLHEKKEGIKRGNLFVNIYVVEVLGIVHVKDAND